MSGLTMMGDLVGTAHYMPPEQILDFREVKPAADQYALAATLYYLLTGREIHDFPEGNRPALVIILNEDPVPIRSRRPEIPDSLARIIHRALSRVPSDRFRDANALRAALAPFRAGD